MADAYRVSTAIKGLSKEGKASLGAWIARVNASNARAGSDAVAHSDQLSFAGFPESRDYRRRSRRINPASVSLVPLNALFDGAVSRTLDDGRVEYTGTHDGQAFTYAMATDESRRQIALASAVERASQREAEYVETMTLPHARELRHPKHHYVRMAHESLEAAQAEIARCQFAPDAPENTGYMVRASEIRALSDEGRAWFKAIAKNAAGGWRKSNAIAAATEAARELNAGEFVSRSDAYADDLPPPLPRVKPKRAYVRRTKAPAVGGPQSVGLQVVDVPNVAYKTESDGFAGGPPTTAAPGLQVMQAIPVAPAMVASPSDVIDAQELTTPGTPPWLVTLQAELSGDTTAPELTGYVDPDWPEVNRVVAEFATTDSVTHSVGAVTIHGLEVATPGFVLNARDPTEARTMARHLRRGDYRKALDLHARAA